MKTFKKILIANRGEIAQRVIRAARQWGIRTVAVYAPDDAESLHVTLADEAFLLPGKTLGETYLDQQKIIRVALASGAEAIHPGYGFLSENASFADKVTRSGIVFIGPSAENIHLMGEKNQSLAYVQSLGMPILPSLRGKSDELMRQVDEISFPVMVKASNGGGGKGMIICHSAQELVTALKTAERQAIAWFGNGELFVEKYLPRARHVEVQLMGDHQGNILHFYERECTMQRRFQKIIEEAPSPSVSKRLREQLALTALTIARSMNYRNAGTIEFLLDESGQFYFLEMNTRIQVEHPVTEMVTGTDLVALQLLVAAGNPLPMRQQDIQLSGHAIEVRLCAEDASRNFLPSAGILTQWELPQDKNTRVETFVSRGKNVSPNYDSLLAKIIVKGESRVGAIGQMQKVLSQSVVSGISTNLSFLLELVSGKVFQKNKLYTRYVDENLEAINASVLRQRETMDKGSVVAAFLIFQLLNKPSEGIAPWQQIGFWRMAPNVEVCMEGITYSCRIEAPENGHLFKINGKEYPVSHWQMTGQRLHVHLNMKNHMFHCQEEKDHTIITTQGFPFRLQGNFLLEQAKVERLEYQDEKVFQNLISAELFGKVLKLSVVEGETVVPGLVLLTLESMKTEIHVQSPVHGRVKKLHIKEGNAVVERQLLLELEAIKGPEI
ncbi:MAG TPA: biotin carboxylase N-terminal domain-containing protein [Prolixibacteraceae bacterium]|nr:biotin carboxylase N-terminal domain-containing protein [Prolixibacteraceae bacterium]